MIRCYFRQDNAPAQVAKTTKKWLEKKSIRLIFLLGQIPDLNPIVNIWSHFKLIRTGRHFSTTYKVIEAIDIEWNNTDSCKKHPCKLGKAIPC